MHAPPCCRLTQMPQQALGSWQGVFLPQGSQFWEERASTVVVAASSSTTGSPVKNKPTRLATPLTVRPIPSDWKMLNLLRTEPSDSASALWRLLTSS